MQEKESIMVVWCELKIPSPGLPHLTTIKDSYNISFCKFSGETSFKFITINVYLHSLVFKQFD